MFFVSKTLKMRLQGNVTIEHIFCFIVFLSIVVFNIFSIRFGFYSF